LEFSDREHARVWAEAKRLFLEKMAEAAKVEKLDT
jgi:hypothetical protein